MKILIVDDEAPARDRLAHMLGSIDDVQTAGEASNGIEAVEMVQSTRPDVVPYGYSHAWYGWFGSGKAFNRNG